MIKHLKFLFLFIFSFFLFIPDDTFALTSYTPKSITFVRSDFNQYTVNLQQAQWNNINLYGFQITDNSTWNSVNIGYDFQNFKGNLQGIIFIGNRIVSNTSTNFALSLKNGNNIFSCNVYNVDAIKSDTGTYSRGNTSYSFYCPSVELNGDTTLITNYIFGNAKDSFFGVSPVTAISDETTQILTQQQKQLEESKKTNDFLKDDTPDENININQDNLTDESGIQNLLLMPLTLMNAVNNGFNSSCSTFSLGSLYGHDLSFKCFTISDIIGSNLAGIIDIIISGIFIYIFSKHLRKVFDRTTNLENEEGDVI